MRKIALVTAALAMSVPALAQQQMQGAQQLHRDITQANERFEQAFNSGDIGALARLYRENATVLPPGAPMQRGRQDIQAFWRQQHQAGLRDLKLDTVNVERFGDAVREIGRFSASISGGGVMAASQTSGAAASATGGSATGSSSAAGGGSGGESGRQQDERVSGKYVVIWTRSGQGWEIDTDIWNADR